MKKSRIAKFALLGASAAALAATLSTSTYAWYVSNKTANVTPVAGSTASSGAGSSISLSITGNVNDFRKTISLDDKTYGLNPVDRTQATLGADGTVAAQYRVLDESTPTAVVPATDAQASAEGYWYEYRFYIKADTGCTVRPTITVTNTTSVLPTQINYSGGYQAITGDSAPDFTAQTVYTKSNAGTYSVVATEPADWSTTYTTYYYAAANKVTGVQPGADFYVNALNALGMSLGMQKGTAFSSSVTDFVGLTTSGAINNYSNPVVANGEYMKLTALENAQKPTGATEATGGAQAYYNEIAGATLTGEATTSYATTNGFANMTLEANTPYLLVYHLWLDGADDQCFNACAGQTFSVAFDFTVTA